jgi:hypothetical protein
LKKQIEVINITARIDLNHLKLLFPRILWSVN